MKILPLFFAWMAGSAILHGESLVEEARFIGMLHELQYTETIGQVQQGSYLLGWGAQKVRGGDP